MRATLMAASGSGVGENNENNSQMPGSSQMPVTSGNSTSTQEMNNRIVASYNHPASFPGSTNFPPNSTSSSSGAPANKIQKLNPGTTQGSNEILFQAALMKLQASAQLQNTNASNGNNMPNNMLNHPALLLATMQQQHMQALENASGSSNGSDSPKMK